MTDVVPVSITILEKEYVVSCPPGEEESLRESARVLGERMSSARESGKTLGTERLAVVTALNIVHEYLAAERTQRDETARAVTDIGRIQEKIAASLGRRDAEGDVD